MSMDPWMKDNQRLFDMLGRSNHGRNWMLGRAVHYARLPIGDSLL